MKAYTGYVKTGKVYPAGQSVYASIGRINKISAFLLSYGEIAMRVGIETMLKSANNVVELAKDLLYERLVSNTRSTGALASTIRIDRDALSRGQIMIKAGGTLPFSFVPDVKKEKSIVSTWKRRFSRKAVTTVDYARVQEEGGITPTGGQIEAKFFMRDAANTEYPVMAADLTKRMRKSILASIDMNRLHHGNEPQFIPRGAAFTRVGYAPTSIIAYENHLGSMTVINAKTGRKPNYAQILKTAGFPEMIGGLE